MNKYSIKKVLMIGAGNLSTQLSLALQKKGIQIVQVYSRTEKSAKALAVNLACGYTTDLNELNSNVDLVVISISDNEIKKFSEQLNFKNLLVVHTSGSIPMADLSAASNCVGVFYPLQSFSKGKKIDFSPIPLFIETNNLDDKNRLVELGKLLSNSVHLLNSEQRKKLHLAAVFVNNFTNHLFAIGQQLCKENGLDHSVLKPLITETIQKAFELSPLEAQTGPAKRGDKIVMNEHLSMLTDHDLYQKIYTFVSNSIYKTYHAS